MDASFFQAVLRLSFFGRCRSRLKNAFETQTPTEMVDVSEFRKPRRQLRSQPARAMRSNLFVPLDGDDQFLIQRWIFKKCDLLQTLFRRSPRKVLECVLGSLSIPG